MTTTETETNNTAQPRPGAETATAIERVLVDDHRELLAFLQQRLGTREDAEEALQSFMLRAIERSSTVREVRTVRGWLSRLLATAIADSRRAAAARQRREVRADTLKPETLQEEADADQAICLCLYRLLPTLEADYAEMIRRVDLEEERRSLVAADLGITPNNLAVRLYRARQALKGRLEELCLTCPEHGFLDCNCDPVAARRKLAHLAPPEGEASNTLREEPATAGGV